MNMASAFDVPDPSDWLETPVSKLAPVETALRCQVCKDFFATPVITSCSHTFCSLCIRRCLTNDGKCPACRAVDQELRLRPNWIVQELVDAFQSARQEILQLGRHFTALEDEPRHENKKRKFEVTDTDDEEALVQSGWEGRRTRSQNKSERHSDNADESGPIHDGLIPCPICAKRMKEEDVFTHLDVHSGPSHSTKAEANDAVTSMDSALPLETGTTSRIQPKAPMERLPQLNYSLLNENALRKKLSALGMPTHGPRALLVRRHTEWVNLVNSNCDSRTPKSKRELLHELDVWERSQGRQVMNNGTSGSSVMDKDFDGAGWASKHNGDFQKLIAEARKKAKIHKVAEDAAEATNDRSEKVEPKLGIEPTSGEQNIDQPLPRNFPTPLSFDESHMETSSPDLDTGAQT